MFYRVDQYTEAANYGQFKILRSGARVYFYQDHQLNQIIYFPTVKMATTYLHKFCLQTEIRLYQLISVLTTRWPGTITPEQYRNALKAYTE